jgi:glucose-1-phosphate adenylyltransferase
VFQYIGALRQGGPDFVLILSGDHVYSMDYHALLRDHAETGADLTIATVEHDLRKATHFGVVEVDTECKVIGFQEKPPIPRPIPSRPASALVSMGVYVFKKQALIRALIDTSDGDTSYDFGHHVIPSLIGSAHVRAYDFRDEVTDSPCYWRDIGTLDSYYETSMDLVQPETPFDPYSNDDWPSCPERYQRSQQVGSPDGGARSSSQLRSRLAPGFQSEPLMERLPATDLATRSIVSPGVRLDDGCLIESSVLMGNVWVGKGAHIRHAIIEEGVHIPAGFQIGFDMERDRKHYFVTDAGVIVISQTPRQTRPTVFCAPRRTTARRGIGSKVA